MMSFGMIFNPPIKVKTMFQIIERQRMKMAAPFRKFSWMKNIMMIGKKARIGMDSKISNIGRKILSVKLELVANMAKGMAITRATI